MVVEVDWFIVFIDDEVDELICLYGVYLDVV